MNEDLVSRSALIAALAELQSSRAPVNPTLLKVLRIVKGMPAVQSKEAQVLAEILYGTPLEYPCNKMWVPEGWCKEHCTDHCPDVECWLKYAEVMASEG